MPQLDHLRSFVLNLMGDDESGTRHGFNHQIWEGLETELRKYTLARVALLQPLHAKAKSEQSAILPL